MSNYSKDSKNGNGRSSVETKSLEKVSSMMADLIWMDGELVPFDRAKVHFLSPSLHYGIGVFEGLRCYETARGPAVFRMHEHLRRFLNSVRVLGVDDIHHDLETLRDAVCRVVFANNLTECYIRPLLYFEGSLGLDLDEYYPAVGIAAWQWDPLLGKKALEVGVNMMVSSVTRIHPNAGMTKSKFSGQYVNPIMVKTMAKRAGFDEAVMLDPEGHVTGCTGENIFLVQDNVLLTPPKSATLQGVTRDTLIKLAHDNSYRVSEELITRDQLYYADEVFVCGTAAEVVGVREIDYRPIGTGMVGPLTRQLQALYHDTVKGRTRRYLDWLDYLVMEPMI